MSWAILIEILTFLAPHILSMLGDAVTKWNHEVPASRAMDFWQDYNLITDKILNMPNGRKFSTLVEYQKSSPASSSLLVDLALVIENDLNDLFEKISSQLVASIVDGDFMLFHESMIMLEEWKTPMSDSFKMSRITGFGFGANSPDVLLIDDALLGLARLMPKRHLAPFGVLSVRDLKVVRYSGLSDETVKAMKLVFNEMYDITVKDRSNGFINRDDISVILRPKTRSISDHAVFNIHGININESTVYDLAQKDCYQCADDRWYIHEDPNVSVNSILNKVIGSSITSISTVVPDCFAWLAIVYSEYKNISIEDSNNQVRNKPWKSTYDGMNFARPLLLLNYMKDIHKAEDDFKTMENLIKLYRLQKTVYSKTKTNRKSVIIPREIQQEKYMPYSQYSTEPSAPLVSQLMNEDVVDIERRNDLIYMLHKYQPDHMRSSYLTIGQEREISDDSEIIETNKQHLKSVKHENEASSSQRDKYVVLPSPRFPRHRK